MGRAELGLGAPGGQCSEVRGRSRPWAVFRHTGQHRTYEGSVPVPDTELGPSTASECWIQRPGSRTGTFTGI